MIVQTIAMYQDRILGLSFEKGHFLIENYRAALQTASSAALRNFLTRGSFRFSQWRCFMTLRKHDLDAGITRFGGRR